MESCLHGNITSVWPQVPGFAEHQAQVAAVLRLQGVDPGQQAYDAAIALVQQQEAELAALGAGRR